MPIFHQNDDFEEEVEEESVTQFVRSPEHHDFNQPEITSNNGISESGLDEVNPSSGGHEFNHEQSLNLCTGHQYTVAHQAFAIIPRRMKSL